MSRERLMTLPNAVSMSRLLLAVLFVAQREPVTRFAVLVVASATDFLDGWIARRRHATSRSGALIDPTADRIFVLAALCAYLVEGAISIGAYLTLLSSPLRLHSILWLLPRQHIRTEQDTGGP